MSTKWISAAVATIVLMATTAALIGQVAPAGAATVVPLPPTGTYLARWAATHMANDQVVTQAQATAIAQQYNVITVNATTFAPYVASMHQANPNLKMLPYHNAAFAYSTTDYPSSWYARNANGGFVQSTAYGNYMMDMRNRSWLNAAAQLCLADRSTHGFDGCYYDMLTTGPLDPGFLTSQPIDPATGAVWTKANYVSALVAAVQVIRDVNPGVPIVGNTLGGGNSYFKTDGSSTRPVLDGLDAGHEEDFLHTASQKATQYPTQKAWINAINVLVDAGARGDSVMAQTKLWVAATPAQIDSWYRFAAASFLLGTNGSSYFTFSTSRTMAAATATFPYDQVNIGTPTGPYAAVSGAYERTFTGGLVLVNPSTASATVSLAGSYTDIDGGTRYTTTITLAPDQAVVLSKS